MSSAFEPYMDALFAHISNAVTISIVCDVHADDPVLTNVSSFTGLFPGLPVFGPAIPAGAVIATMNINAATLTLSDPPTAASPAETLTTGFLTKGRRLRHWAQVTDQPAFFLRRVGTMDEYNGDLPITTLECEAWIYSKAGADPGAVPDVALSNLDMLVRQSIAPGPRDEERFTLNDLVYWCRIEGRSDYSPGDQGGQGISRIPLRITLPF